MVVWTDVRALWEGLTPEIQAALVGAVATVSTATLGALAVIWQIGRQAHHAIQQDRHNEALKLKLQVYEQIVATCRAAEHAIVELSSDVSGFHSNVSLYRQNASQWPVPRARATVVLDKKSDLDRMSTELIFLTERWQIIDPRIQIVRIATNVAMNDINTNFLKYFRLAVRIMPREGETWWPPDDPTAQQLEELGRALLDALMTFGSYIYDFRVEMQNLLLGELFEQKLPPRGPVDPKMLVIEFERHKELAMYFEKETAWGREKSRTEADVRAAQTRDSEER